MGLATKQGDSSLMDLVLDVYLNAGQRFHVERQGPEFCGLGDSDGVIFRVGENW